MLITLILRIIKVKILKLNLRSKIISISLNNLFYWGKKKRWKWFIGIHSLKKWRAFQNILWTGTSDSYLVWVNCSLPSLPSHHSCLVTKNLAVEQVTKQILKSDTVELESSRSWCSKNVFQQQTSTSPGALAKKKCGYFSLNLLQKNLLCNTSQGVPNTPYSLSSP